MLINRIIGKYKGQQPGPMLIAIGGIHGNEPSGSFAIQEILQLLEREPIRNPNFIFKGTFIGFNGNCQAIEKAERFIEKDLNRQWTKENIANVFLQKSETLKAEDLEIFELITAIKAEIKNISPEKILFLDLHTTTADGGIFSVVTDDSKSINTAQALYAPVIKGLLRGLEGTSLHYFTTENIGIETTAVCFEAGQHNDPLSVNRGIAAILNALKSVSCIDSSDIENRHNELLKKYSEGLPRVSELLYCHRIQPDDNFKMKEGYQNFQLLKKGEIIASDKKGDFHTPFDCQILMPLYQKQGNDGFFLIKPCL